MLTHGQMAADILETALMLKLRHITYADVRYRLEYRVERGFIIFILTVSVREMYTSPTSWLP